MKSASAPEEEEFLLLRRGLARSHEDGKRMLKQAKKIGLDEVVWHMYGLENGEYPPVVQENHSQYVRQLLDDCNILQTDTHIYLLDSDFALIFRASAQDPERPVKESVKYREFFIENREDHKLSVATVSGRVPVRTLDLKLEYEGYKLRSEIPVERSHLIARADNTCYHS
ncbi:hypothetical protein JXB11_04410 [Candidatus Woesearchaeota archaeon]|nr:hypothetical protein [Candidatus Woesearchaeota archaeon]